MTFKDMEQKENKLIEVCEVDGCMLYKCKNELGDYRYIWDGIGGGYIVHDTTLASPALLVAVLKDVNNAEIEEITILREQLRGTREELSEARKQRDEAIEQWEIDQKSMKALFDENTRLKEYIKKSSPFLND